ncbi:MAG: GIDE domain-containing protein [Pseudomonadota bacterium]
MTISERILQATPESFWFCVIMGAIFALLCFYLAFRYLLRARLVADIPTAKIRSAAQGYTELEGHAQLMDGPPIRAPLSGTPCVWYSYKIEEKRTHSLDRRQGSIWQTIESGVSDAIFHLQDDTGLCIVDPEGAEVTPSIRVSWRARSRMPHIVAPAPESLTDLLFSTGNYRFTEQRIHPGDRVYAIGFFESIGSHEPVHSHTEIRNLLSTWKQDKTLLLKRFDQDGNGEIDLLEWENAREQAEKEVLAARREQAKQPQFHLLKKPQNGTQPFILSNVPQQKMITRYSLLAAFTALGFLTFGAALTWAVSVRVATGS